MTPSALPADALFRVVPTQGRSREDSLSFLSPITGEWIEVAGAARRLWEGLEYPATLSEIVAVLEAEYDAPAEAIAEDLRPVLADFVAYGLVEEAGGPRSDPFRDRYLGLLKRSLGNMLYPELELQIEYLMKEDGGGLSGIPLQRHLRDIEDRRPSQFKTLMAAKQEGGSPWRFGHSMIGQFRLSNIERCAERVVAEGVPGDFLEAGVCRGGATIFMRALQIALGAPERRTWVVDSFQGVPPPVKEIDQRYGFDLSEAVAPWLACSEKKVRELFARYGMLDSNVEFVAGWVAESLPAAPIGALAILRIDVDIHSSTAECLDLLYDKLSPGGYVIVDDYGFFECCCDAVEEFRERRGITEPIEWIDRWGIFWRKGAASG